ncbi:hypothetical protein [Lentzea californiensis]|nr:hypothetical protein [Lentzea californiensis]MCR3746705.1 hypothetical protein [Lentzea californiensis]
MLRVSTSKVSWSNATRRIRSMIGNERTVRVAIAAARSAGKP